MDSLRAALPTLPHRDQSISTAFLITLEAFVVFTLIYRCSIQIGPVLDNLFGRIRRRFQSSPAPSRVFNHGDVVRDKTEGNVNAVRGDRENQIFLEDDPNIGTSCSYSYPSQHFGKFQTAERFKDGDVVRDKTEGNVYVVKGDRENQIFLEDDPNKGKTYSYPYASQHFEKVKTAEGNVKLVDGGTYHLTDKILANSATDDLTSRQFEEGEEVKIDEYPSWIKSYFRIVSDGQSGLFIVPRKMLKE